jgi:CRP-like cAMP-binding protein
MNANSLNFFSVVPPVAGAKETPAFDPVSFFSRLGAAGNMLRFRRKDIIFAQAALADAVFYIQSGRVKLTVVSADGKEATIALCSKGDFVGEECLAGRQPRRLATVSAISDCSALKIDRKVLEHAVRRDNVFFEFFFNFLLARQVRLQEDLIHHLCHTSEQRLARLLLLLAGLGDSGKNEAVIPKVSQEVLAEMVGTTRSRVSFFMNRFRSQGLIDYNGEILVRSSLAQVIAGPQNSAKADQL